MKKKLNLKKYTRSEKEVMFIQARTGYAFKKISFVSDNISKYSDDDLDTTLEWMSEL